MHELNFDFAPLADNGWMAIDDFLDARNCQTLRIHLLTLQSEGQLKKSAVGKHENHHVDHGVRGDYTSWIDQDEVVAQPVLEAVRSLMREINRQLYLGLRDFEIHYAIYPPHTLYRKHVDRHASGSHRILSFVFYLNETWKDEDGGQLRIWQPDGSHIDILPCSGRLVLFNSDRLHEVLETKKQRLSITGWMLNEERFW